MHKKQIIFYLLIFNFLFILNAQNLSDSLKLHYTFATESNSDVTDVTGNGFNATLQNGAQVVKEGKYIFLKLGTSNGYLNMGTAVGDLIKTLNDFTVSTYLYIDPSISITGNGNFLWSFSTSSACTANSGKYSAYRVNIQRYAQSSGGYNRESGLSIGTTANQGYWHHVVYTQSGYTGTIYIDGVEAKSATLTLKPSDIGAATTYNWLGRPPFSSDNYLKGASYYDFRIYNRSLSVNEINSFTNILPDLNNDLDSIAVEQAKANLTLNGLDALINDITLPSIFGDNVSLVWNSSNTNNLSNSGVVTRPNNGQSNATLTLTVTLSKGNYSTTKEFQVTVLANIRDLDAVSKDAANISIENKKCYFLGKIQLPDAGNEGTNITWKSTSPDFLTDAGDIIKLPSKGQGSKMATITATVTKGNASTTKDFVVCINENDGNSGYLWVYFTGNAAYTQENIFFALSSDGLNFKTLNDGNYVIKADTISDMNGIRDPHIMKGPDGVFYMVATDMRSSLGWSSNHGIVLMKSTDLINWKHTTVDIKAKFSKFADITRAWAPETIYDEKTGKLMVYFSLLQPGGHDIIYYAYANDDFTDLATEPQVLFDNGVSTIDGNIVYRDGIYNLFFKTEDAADKGYKKAVSNNLIGPYTLIDKYLDQSNDAVEGGCVFKKNNEEKYVLMYDLYSTGKYEFTQSDSLDNFKVINVGASRDFTPRHGTIIGITQDEAKKLAEKWGSSSLLTFGTALAPEIKPINIEVNETTQTVFFPVKNGTDLSSFDPQITASVAGITVNPQGMQNFTNGAVNYSLSLNGTSKNYNVTSAINNNAIINGYYADPEILYSKKTKKFYIYPTSDGFASWGGFYFNVFSSLDLVNWSNEGVVIDMHNSNQISWANGNAWAPSIIEKEINGEYKYVMYFSGGIDGGTKKIGYAVSESPKGPFTVSSAPLISTSPTGSGQQIDSDVFTDPISGKTYLYWGNGYLAVAELNDDLLSLKTTPKVITPASNYTEGAYVFYRNGKYYFTWSYGNTGNADYSVYYGYSTSPTGTITIPDNNKILAKNTTLGINGPGHNSIVQIPNKDEWYIVYHRISRPNGINNTVVGAGNVRELCIDKLEFNTDGTIKTVIPTLEGIQPVDLSSVPNAVEYVNNNSNYGAVTSVELYTISGVKLNINKLYNIPSGVYLVKKTFENGKIKLEKKMFDNKNTSSILK